MPFSTMGGAKHHKAHQTEVHKLYTSQTCSVYTRPGLLNKIACLKGDCEHRNW